jgi:hypothetical protein
MVITTEEQRRLVLENMAELLELPETAYLKAKERYEDIGQWLSRDESKCRGNEPHIFPQGSFRLGTAIRPLDGDETYDLDLACKLDEGISKVTHSQHALKGLVGHEIQTYRLARNLKAPVQEKHRCWRLEYQDDLSFHIDIVPCIPADEQGRVNLMKAMINVGESEDIAGRTAQLTVSITDDRHHGYRQICDDWNISNPEGYALWFEYRMNQALRSIIEKAQIDRIPVFARKTALQRTVQLLKRHRDSMFKADTDVKPISVIITTLAARAYQGEQDVGMALTEVLSRMGDFVNQNRPKVPNPVDPAEDFADRWSMPEYRHLKLEQNFWNWLLQAKSDFESVGSSRDTHFIADQAESKFSIHIDAQDLAKRLGVSSSSVTMVTPKAHVISAPPKSWKL